MPDDKSKITQRQRIDQRIWDVIAKVPKGKVASYGQVARVAELGRAARRISPALKRAPESLALPWHRVLCANGKLAFPEQHPNYKRQLQLLRNEGVVFNGRIDMQVYRWHQGLDDDSSRLVDEVIWGEEL